MTRQDVDLYAEQGVIASIFNDPDSIQDVVGFLSAEDFSEPRHKRIYDAQTELFRAGKRISLVNTAEHLRDRGVLAEVGGAEFIAAITDPSLPYVIDADTLTYGEIVRDESMRRALKMQATWVLQNSEVNSGVSVEEILTQSQNGLRHVADRLVDSDGPQGVGDLTEDFMVLMHERASRESSIQGIPSGFLDLDKHTTGFTPGQFIIVAARPGVGKSTLAVDFARAAAIKADFSVMFFSLEMSKKELMDRIISAESHVPLNAIRGGTLNEDQWDKVAGAIDTIGSKNLILDESPHSTVDQIRVSASRQAATPAGLDLIIVDYLQLMNGNSKSDSRQQEVSEMSRSLKIMAKELGVPIIALSQLNRGPEQRTDKRPKISDLRESGSLEQDADIVLLIHRPDDDPEGVGMSGQTQLLLEKNRNGPQAQITLIPLLEYAKFGNSSGMYAAEPEYLPSNEEEVMGRTHEPPPTFEDPLEEVLVDPIPADLDEPVTSAW